MRRQRADVLTMTARLLPGTTLAQWYSENEPLLQQEPTRQERNMVVAVTLLPIFAEQPDCWEAFDWLNDDTHGTFAEYPEDWYSCVPEKHRSFVRQIAKEFGIERQP
jgi:hypothetical protein